MRGVHAAAMLAGRFNPHIMKNSTSKISGGGMRTYETDQSSQDN